MKIDRRRFIELVYGLPFIGTSRFLRADPNESVNKLAIVVGVNKVNSAELPPLTAAASGAIQVSEWLNQESFTVLTFVDERVSDTGEVIEKKINSFDMIQKIKPYIESPALQELVVYFAGHGYNNSHNEFWLLSDGPYNPNEAINFIACSTVIRKQKIKNVTFIVDACRSTTADHRIADLTGFNLFSNPRQRPDHDQHQDMMFATRRGRSSYEFSDYLEAHKEGIFTKTLLESYILPPKDIIFDQDGKKVITNRGIEKYLEIEVQKRAQEKSLKLKQKPQIDVVSSDNYYLGEYRPKTITTRGRSKGTVPPLAAIGDTQPEPTVLDIANSRISSLNSVSLVSTKQLDSTIEHAALNIDFDASFRRIESAIMKGQQQDDNVMVPNVTLVGATINRAVYVAQGRNDPKSLSIHESGLIDHNELLVHKNGSIVIEFSTGNGTVIASLPDYYCTIVVESDLVASVSYREKYSSDAQTRDFLTELHAAVTTVAELGEFRIEGTGTERAKNARNLATTIRIGKSTDPTLGIYAAYAYSQAGLFKNVQSVEYSMDRTPVFDVRMLADTLADLFYPYENTVPFCPMLSQGWHLLETHFVQLPKFLQDARQHRKDSLWTTFGPQGMQILFDNFRA